MYRFFLDALAAVRFRFFNTAHYHYPLTIAIAIIVTIGMINTAAMAPVFGVSSGIMIFWILITLVKWLLLSFIMRHFLTQSGQPKQNWRGYVLITDALILPMILSLYWPQQFMAISFFWQIWVMAVQFFGFMRLSQANGFKIIGGYLVYGILAIICSTVILMVFDQLGWIDITGMENQLQQLLNQMATQG